MQRWTSKALSLPISFSEVSRLDLELINLRRDVASFTAYVFLNVPRLARDAGRDHPHCAGSFSIFAQEECWGDDGHCDWSVEPVSDFDRTPPHHLAPINVLIDATPTLDVLNDPTALVVTIVAASQSDPEKRRGVIIFDRLEARAYQRSSKRPLNA